MIKINQSCASCKHRLTFGCKAYPNGEIPYDIAEGNVLHTKVRSDQVGSFVFERGQPDQDAIIKQLENWEN